jgi:hypothetical protein
LTKLERLVIGPNFFSGTIPSEIGELLELVEFRMPTNFFNGTIPTEFGKLTKLTVLDLSNNLVDGTVPSQLGNITTLREVLLGVTGLSGSVPAELCAIAADPTLALDILVVDCANNPPTITCAVPLCCSSCTNVTASTARQ